MAEARAGTFPGGGDSDGGRRTRQVGSDGTRLDSAIADYDADGPADSPREMDGVVRVVEGAGGIDTKASKGCPMVLHTQGVALDDADERIRRWVARNADWSLYRLTECGTLASDSGVMAWRDDSHAWGRGPAQRIPLLVNAHVMRLWGIDTVAQEFKCRLWVQLRWVSSRRYAALVEVGGEGLARLWRPKLYCLNNVDVAAPQPGRSGQVQAEEHFNADGTFAFTELSTRCAVEGSFADSLQLRRFPFDMQMLQVKLVMWNCPQVCEPRLGTPGRPFPMRVSFVRGSWQLYDDGFVQSESWVHRMRVELVEGMTPAARDHNWIRYPVLKVNIAIQRRFAFYVWTIMVPFYCIVTFSFTSFFIHPDDIHDKLALILTVILTLVAFKFLIVSFVPSTSYLTYLDKYILSGFAFTFLVGVQNVLLSQDYDMFVALNLWTGLGLLVAWNVLHLGLIVRARQLLAKGRREMQELMDGTQTGDSDSGVKSWPDALMRPDPLVPGFAMAGWRNTITRFSALGGFSKALNKHLGSVHCFGYKTIPDMVPTEASDEPGAGTGDFAGGLGAQSSSGWEALRIHNSMVSWHAA